MHPLSSSAFSPHECKIDLDPIPSDQNLALGYIDNPYTILRYISNRIYVQATNGLTASAACPSGAAVEPVSICSTEVNGGFLSRAAQHDRSRNSKILPGGGIVLLGQQPFGFRCACATERLSSSGKSIFPRLLPRVCIQTFHGL